MIFQKIHQPHNRACYDKFWWCCPSHIPICDICRRQNYRHHSMKWGLGDLWFSLGVGNHAIPDPPVLFHPLYMATQWATPLSWFPILINGLVSWWWMPRPPPVPLLCCANGGTIYHHLPTAGAGHDTLYWTLSCPVDLWPSVLWQHIRSPSSTRPIDLGWGVSAPPTLLKGGWF